MSSKELLNEKIKQMYINEKDIPKCTINKKKWINDKVSAIRRDIEHEEYIKYMGQTKYRRGEDPFYGFELAYDSDD